MSPINPMIQLTWQEIEKKTESFKQKFTQAVRDGFFYVEIPEEHKKRIEEAKKLGNSLRTNDFLKGFQFGDPRLGYQIRGSQAVAFCAMKDKWEKVFPEPVKELANEMNKLALTILKSALTQLGVPENLWAVATGELTDAKGSEVFTLTHYKPSEDKKDKIGLITHKDSGWITILFIDKTGLETSKDGKHWTPIPPKEGYYVVNFGRAFELLFASEDKLRASLHRVRRLEEERLSFGVFINHREQADLFQIDEKGNLKQIGTYEQYLKKCFAEFQALQDELKAQEESSASI